MSKRFCSVYLDSTKQKTEALVFKFGTPVWSYTDSNESITIHTNV